MFFDMSSEKTSTIVFPLPLELIRPLLGSLTPTPAPAAETAQAAGDGTQVADHAEVVPAAPEQA